MILDELLCCAGSAGAPAPGAQAAWTLSPREMDRQIRWAVQGGLGPLLLHTAAQRAAALPDDLSAMLVSADLTARVRQGAIEAAIAEVLEASAGIGARPLLLKGAWTCHTLYPHAHLRPMGDVDVWLSRPECIALQEVLCGRGFQPAGPEAAFPYPHHLPPLQARAHDVWIELHYALFPANDPLAAADVFSPASVEREAVEGVVGGARVRGLGNELLLAYLASSWIRDLTLEGFHPTFLVGLVDAARLIARSALDWTRLVELLDNEVAAASVLALLGYLDHRCPGSGPFAAIASLRRRQSIFGRGQAVALNWALDRHLLEGRPWRLKLPPPVPGRYSVARQLRKRLSRPA